MHPGENTELRMRNKGPEVSGWASLSDSQWVLLFAVVVYFGFLFLFFKVWPLVKLAYELGSSLPLEVVLRGWSSVSIPAKALKLPFSFWAEVHRRMYGLHS